MGKMVDAQSITIATAAIEQAGNERAIPWNRLASVLRL